MFDSVGTCSSNKKGPIKVGVGYFCAYETLAKRRRRYKRPD